MRVLVAALLMSLVACDDGENTGGVDDDGGGGRFERRDGGGGVLDDAGTSKEDAFVVDASVRNDSGRGADQGTDRPLDAGMDGAVQPGAARVRGRLVWTAGPAGNGPGRMRFSGHGLKVEGRLRP